MVTFLNPEEIIQKLNLRQDLAAAEFGCGPGGFTIPLARRLRQGIVYALDIQEEPLSALLGRAKAEGLSNIKTIRCDLEEPRGSTLQDNLLDLVLLSNILFQSEERETMLKEAKRIVRSQGRIVVIDWKPDSPFGPEEKKVSFEEVHKIIKRLEMKLVEEIDVGTYHWGAVFEKS